MLQKVVCKREIAPRGVRGESSLKKKVPVKETD